MPLSNPPPRKSRAWLLRAQPRDGLSNRRQEEQVSFVQWAQSIRQTPKGRLLADARAAAEMTGVELPS